MKCFLEAVVKNEKALERMKRMEELSFAEQREQITAVAAEMGITLTEDDFMQFGDAELTDAELEQTAGGMGQRAHTPG